MTTRKELTQIVREKYVNANTKEKGLLLDHFVKTTGYHRKHALRLMHAQSPVEREDRKQGRLYDEAVRESLRALWEASDRLCSKRLVVALPHLLQSMERHKHLEIDDEVRDKLSKISAATIDRMLAPMRQSAGRRRRRNR